MKRLFVNADDFGLTESVNEGIVESHSRGIVTATTWMANGDAADHAVDLAPDSLDVGLHLALQDIPPLSRPDSFKSLLSQNGRFPSGHYPVVAWILRNRRALDVIRREWHAQLAKFKTLFGRTPTHIDSHKHVALFPHLQQFLLDIATEADSVRVRTPIEISYRPSSFIFSAAGMGLKKKTRRTNLPRSDAFLGYRDTGRMTQPRLDTTLHRVREGVTELMVHPGTHDEPGGYQRKAETLALTSETTRRLVDDLGILLVSPTEMA